MDVTSEATSFDGVQQWPEMFADFYDRIAYRFGRREIRQRARRYVIGLLGKVNVSGPLACQAYTPSGQPAVPAK